MWQDERALVALSRRECVTLLGTEQVGRVVFTERALPAIVPVSYAVVDGAVCFATRTGTGLALAARGGVLVLEVDRIDPPNRAGWSVVVTGVPDFVDTPVEVARILARLDTWAPGHHNLVLRIPLTVVTGRQILSTQFAPARAIG